MLCLTAGAVAVALATQGFTLAWIHSVEKTEIQEDYRLSDDRLILTEARIKGSGAGFDPPAGAVLDGGWWRYWPNREAKTVTLARSNAPGEWQICLDGLCHALAHYLPQNGSGASPVEITACSGAR
jgi:hypothetical protein